MSQLELRIEKLEKIISDNKAPTEIIIQKKNELKFLKEINNFKKIENGTICTITYPQQDMEYIGILYNDKIPYIEITSKKSIYMDTTIKEWRIIKYENLR